MEKVTYVWKIKLPLTMIYADSVSFLTSTDDRIQKYSSMSVAFPGSKNLKLSPKIKCFDLLSHYLNLSF